MMAVTARAVQKRGYRGTYIYIYYTQRWWRAKTLKWRPLFISQKRRGWRNPRKNLVLIKCKSEGLSRSLFHSFISLYIYIYYTHNTRSIAAGNFNYEWLGLRTGGWSMMAGDDDGGFLFIFIFSSQKQLERELSSTAIDSPHKQRPRRGLRIIVLPYAMTWHNDRKLFSRYSIEEKRTNHNAHHIIFYYYLHCYYCNGELEDIIIWIWRPKVLLFIRYTKRVKLKCRFGRIVIILYYWLNFII